MSASSSTAAILGAQHADWPETRIACGDLREELGRLNRQSGNDSIACGGASFDQALSRLGPVDEYRLTIEPAELGAGLPLSNKAIAARLFLTERTVEAHVKQIFMKLRIDANPPHRVSQPLSNKTPDHTSRVPSGHLGNGG